MVQNFLFSGNQKQVIGVTLTPGIGLEASVLSNDGDTVLKYSRENVEYNFSAREVQDYVQFKTALARLMDKMGGGSKPMIYLVLPNVYFDFMELPPLIDNASIKTAVLSKAEEYYLFKKDEPVSGWCEVVNPDGSAQRKLAYSSFQKTTIDQIKDIAKDLGIQIIGIETSYSATLRGLYIAGFIDDVTDDTLWTAMLIGTNNYTMFYMKGKELINYSEVPLAIKSFSAEEAYQAIVSGSMQLLSNFSSSRLYIISQTDEISASVLKSQMQYDRKIIAIDTSPKYSRKDPVMPVKTSTNFTEARSMTLASIGAADIKNDFTLRLNTMADDPSADTGVYFTTNFLGQTIDVTKEFTSKVAIFLCIAIVLVFGGIYGALMVYNNQLKEKISQLDNQIQEVDTQIQKIKDEQKGMSQDGQIDMNVIIDELAEMNVSFINFYDSISNDIPKNVWLTKYYNKEGNKLAVRGIAESIVDIYEYYKNLKIVSPQSDIKLTELKVVTEDPNSEEGKFLSSLSSIDRDTDRLYSFEISNTQIQIQKEKVDDKGKPLENNEYDILRKPLIPLESTETEKIEQTSQQMKPAG